MVDDNAFFLLLQQTYPSTSLYQASLSFPNGSYCYSSQVGCSSGTCGTYPRFPSDIFDYTNFIGQQYYNYTYNATLSVLCNVYEIPSGASNYVNYRQIYLDAQSNNLVAFIMWLGGSPMQYEIITFTTPATCPSFVLSQCNTHAPCGTASSSDSSSFSASATAAASASASASASSSFTSSSASSWFPHASSQVTPNVATKAKGGNLLLIIVVPIAVVTALVIVLLVLRKKFKRASSYKFQVDQTPPPVPTLPQFQYPVTVQPSPYGAQVLQPAYYYPNVYPTPPVNGQVHVQGQWVPTPTV